MTKSDDFAREELTRAIINVDIVTQVVNIVERGISDPAAKCISIEGGRRVGDVAGVLQGAVAVCKSKRCCGSIDFASRREMSKSSASKRNGLSMKLPCLALSVRTPLFWPG